METAIKVEGITKSYGSCVALKGVSFDVGRGELFGLIGPDGAGKTSLFRILATLLLADEGTAQLNGMDVVRDYQRIRRDVGYMPGRFSLYQDLSVEENLSFFASLFGVDMERNKHFIEDIYSQIEPFKHRRAGKLSGGMKQKLALCCALIHKPSILFLDEPTTGVDPVSRKEFWQILTRLKEEGITMMVSTPYMDEAMLCDRMAMCNEGRFLTIDTPAGIIAGYPYRLWALSGKKMHGLLRCAREYPGVQYAYTFGEVHHLVFKEKNAEVDAFRDYLAQQGFEDVELKPDVAGIEDCYMALTNDTEDGRGN